MKDKDKELKGIDPNEFRKFIGFDPDVEYKNLSSELIDKLYPKLDTDKLGKVVICGTGGGINDTDTNLFKQIFTQPEDVKLITKTDDDI